MGNDKLSRRERRRLAAEAAKQTEEIVEEVPETQEPVVEAEEVAVETPVDEVQTVPAAPVKETTVEETNVPVEKEVPKPASILLSMKTMCDVELEKTVWDRNLIGTFLASFLDTFIGILESNQLTYDDIEWFKSVIAEPNFTPEVLGTFSNVTVKHIGTVVFLSDSFAGKDVDARTCPFNETNLHML